MLRTITDRDVVFVQGDEGLETSSLKQSLLEPKGFVVVAELTGGPGYSFAPIEKFLLEHRDKHSSIPAQFDFVGITLPQSPGGQANIEPRDVVARLNKSGLLGRLDCIPHISCKDNNTDAIKNSLIGLRWQGIQSVLALTGDKPVTSQGVFDIESVGLLSLIRQVNNEEYLKARPEDLKSVHQFFPGAAVSPFKYTEASLMQQYYKMEKKIAGGAEFLITQVGWDWKKSVELIRYMAENEIKVPLLGNVYFLSTSTPAPRLMHDGKLPGCFVSDQLYEKLRSESFGQHIERAAQQAAMYRAIGAAGVDIGGVPDYNTFVKILQLAAQIGSGWEKYRDNLYWPAKDAFYLYDDSGRKATASAGSKKLSERFFDLMHRAILDPRYRGFHLFKKFMKLIGADRGKGCSYKAFNAAEKSSKYLLFECHECGDCYLPENFGYCTIGGCEKGLDNAPCGDATVDGYCGNNLERICIGEKIYKSAATEKNGLQQLRKTLNRPRIAALAHTSSIINYLFARDHTAGNILISIGESIHASIPRTGKVMAALHNLGDDAYTKPGPELEYVKALIVSQADEGADYIAVNVDAFGEKDPFLAVRMMTEYVRLVRRWGLGVPVCLDSSSDNVLIAGLKEWYNTIEPVKPPLVNSIKVYTADRLMPLRRDYTFSFIGLLVSETKPTGPGGSHSVEELLSLARQLYDKAQKAGFKPAEIFFDSTVFPIAIDMPMEPDVPGYTYRAFETIRRIKSDPVLRNCHCSLGISNCCRDLPGRRIGICRAYAAKAMSCGLDAGIVNVSHHYGRTEPDAELMKLIDAFAAMDGSPERLNDAMTLMGAFCAANRKPARLTGSQK